MTLLVIAIVAFVVWKAAPTIITLIQAKVAPEASTEPSKVALHAQLDALIALHATANAEVKADVQALAAKILTLNK